ncbi:hypothetical protein GUJ93_ZPchr0006g42500 [Zizania palustris]|uniref:Secreted protein n=1 Tax=Zizania palustris TaxID=103762 RepID=A0A8J5T774_ZIZPA|nr:hypothetical protein GUJ93_ZPchr0006g42500 [Zizania palustris]
MMWSLVCLFFFTTKSLAGESVSRRQAVVPLPRMVARGQQPAGGAILPRGLAPSSLRRPPVTPAPAARSTGTKDQHHLLSVVWRLPASIDTVRSVVRHVPARLGTSLAPRCGLRRRVPAPRALHAADSPAVERQLLLDGRRRHSTGADVSVSSLVSE